MSKTVIWTIVVIIILAVGIWFWRSRSVTNAPTNNGTSVQSDNTAAMASDLNNANVQDPDFQGIDQDVNSL